MTELRDKTVLITGAGGGFGRHMVQQFRAAGSRVLLTDLTDDALQEAVADAGDGLVATLATDLSTEAGCDELAEVCRAVGVVPDILVNNAGIAVAGRLDHVPRPQWETLLNLNLFAPMRLCDRFLPAMIARGSGHVVNISSIAGWVGSRGLTSYCASKYGLRGFGESLAVDLEGTGVNVTNVYPCFSRTAILDSPQYGYDERLEVPDYIVSEPADVVAQVLRGVRRNRLHVFPDRHARLIHYLVRFAPWLVPVLDRRLHAQAVKAG